MRLDRRVVLSCATLAAFAGAGAGLATVVGAVGGESEDPPVTVNAAYVVHDGSVGIDEAGTVHLPRLDVGTRPVVVGREVRRAPAIEEHVAALDAAARECLVSKGARRIVVPDSGTPPSVHYDDPEQRAQQGCTVPLGKSNAFVMSDEFRVATLAAFVRTRALYDCLGLRAGTPLSGVSDSQFGACSAKSAVLVEG